MANRIVLDGSQQIQGHPEIRQIEIRIGKRIIIHTPESLWEITKLWYEKQEKEEE